MKSQIRVLGIDDGPFSFDQERTPVVGVAMRLPGYVEGVMTTDVEVDGLDSTNQLIEMLANSRYLDQLKLIMLDGAALGGFNVVDIHRINQELDIPIATITREKPDYDEIENALKKHFDDWEKRLHMMKSSALRISTLATRPSLWEERALKESSWPRFWRRPLFRVHCLRRCASRTLSPRPFPGANRRAEHRSLSRI
jgi:endonuclease V-like protein UPF0215 family